MALRDECSDSSKTGKGRRPRGSYMQDIDPYYSTLWSEKLRNPNGLNATRGASDIR